MAKPVQLARCFFDDKDIHDVLSNPRFGERALFKIAQSRGIIFNPDESKSALIRRLSLMPFDWHGLLDLAKQLERPEREEKRAVTRLTVTPDAKILEQALDKVKETRSASCRETFKLEKVGGRNVVRVTYIDIDYSKAKAFQRDQREYVVEIEQVDSQLNIQYTHNQRAKEFVHALAEQLKPKPEIQIENPIELTGIKDAALRTEFFLKLRKLMPDFRPLDVLDIKVERQMESQSDEDQTNSEDEEIDEKAEAEAKSMVKSAALHGHGLLTTELYQQLRNTGYFVHRIIWTSLEKEGDGRLMEFEAGFDDPVLATGFNYDLKKVVPSESDKKKGLSQLETTARERQRVRRAIVTAAYQSLQEIRKSTRPDES